MATRLSDYTWNRLARSAKVRGDEESLHNFSRQVVARQLSSKFSERTREVRGSSSGLALVGRIPLGATVSVRELMTKTVVTVRADEGIQRAACLMANADCGALPVVDGSGHLIGIITDRDITVRLVARALNINSAQVSDCMTSESFACSADDSVEDCMRIMSWNQIRRVPIVDWEHRVIGIVSQSDLARHTGTCPEIGAHGAIAELLRVLSERTGAPGR